MQQQSEKCQNCTEWQKVTGCKTPQDAKVWLTAMQMDILELKRMIGDSE